MSHCATPLSSSGHEAGGQRFEGGPRPRKRLGGGGGVPKKSPKSGSHQRVPRGRGRVGGFQARFPGFVLFGICKTKELRLRQQGRLGRGPGLLVLDAARPEAEANLETLGELHMYQATLNPKP